ncbi:aspartyl protease family protein [uncultured Tenacibaculum sp.]|uniref:aspartyl protease family protein n=1 Tax=uncultured Tenacibaculum sp. TaxID=174713 RepID=UPI00260A8F69|nr:aspartyl protease family protein [uncultured Tenacibaculum sp.]
MNFNLKPLFVAILLCLLFSNQRLSSQNSQSAYKTLAKENIQFLISSLMTKKHEKINTLLDSNVTVSGYKKTKAITILKKISEKVNLNNNYIFKAIHKSNGLIKVRLKMKGQAKDFTYTLNNKGKFLVIDMADVKKNNLDINSFNSYKNSPRTIPFKIRNGFICFELEIKGEKLTFVFDTGAQGTVIAKDVVRRLKLKSKGKRLFYGASGSAYEEIVLIDSYKLNKYLTVKNLPATALDLTELRKLINYNIDGFIGNGLLSAFVTEIDFDNEVITFHKSTNKIEKEYPNNFFLSLNKRRIPVATTKIQLKNGENFKGKALLDTGASGSMYLNAKTVEKYNLESKLEKKVMSKNFSATGTFSVFLSSLESISFLNQKLFDVPVTCSKHKGNYTISNERIGIIGIEILKKYNWVFDYKNQKAYYKRNNNYPIKFGYVCTDFYIEKKENELYFNNIKKDSKLLKEGIKNDFKIISVNGLKVTNYKEILDLIETDNISLEIIYLDNSGKELTVKYQTKRLV